MLVGVFSPVINWCGGAERVAVNIINALKIEGHQVIVLTNRLLNQNTFKYVFHSEVLADQQMVFPLRLLSPTDYHNIYIDGLRSLMLKSKCRVLIDTYSNAILPGVNVSYIHYPLLKSVETGLPHLRNRIFFSPYQSYLKLHEKDMNKRLVFANSKFTAEAIKAEIGMDPHVLYPCVSNDILNSNELNSEFRRGNNVITVARISGEKKLEIIPLIAKSTPKDVSFIIVGLLNSERVLSNLLKLTKELKVSERVKILTNVKREQLRRLMLNSKVYLHPTPFEHFGISIVEGMASGCIPVVHNSGGPREFVPQDQRFDGIEDAAEKVEKALNCWSWSRARELAKNAQGFSEDNFSKRFINIFNSHFHICN